MKRNGEFTVNIALVKNGKPILGVIYVPVKGWLYYGSSNGSYREIGGKKQLLPLVNKSTKYEGYTLGIWVNTLRGKKAQLKEKIKILVL